MALAGRTETLDHTAQGYVREGPQDFRDVRDSTPAVAAMRARMNDHLSGV